MLDINEIKNTVIEGDAIRVLRDIPGESVDLIVTSPPYFNQKDYSQYGDEQEYFKFIFIPYI